MLAWVCEKSQTFEKCMMSHIPSKVEQNILQCNINEGIFQICSSIYSTQNNISIGFCFLFLYCCCCCTDRGLHMCLVKCGVHTCLSCSVCKKLQVIIRLTKVCHLPKAFFLIFTGLADVAFYPAVLTQNSVQPKGIAESKVFRPIPEKLLVSHLAHANRVVLAMQL